MRVFLDSSVLLAAAGSDQGASRYVILNQRRARMHLITADYCIKEVEFNLAKLGPSSSQAWYTQIKPRLKIVPVRLSLTKILIYPRAKDRPVIITALGVRAGCLLTLDKSDFKGLLGENIYGMWILSPAQFLSSKLI